MRIRFDATATDGPKLIREIPDFPLCYIEGENGIGKTLAVRVLEVATLGKPYTDSHGAWATLREQLGHVTIRVDGLSEGRQLRYELTPETWPEDPALLSESTRLGAVYNGGTPISFHEAAAMFRALRIGGDETLQVAVGSELAVLAGRIRRGVGMIEPRAASWDRALQGIVDVASTATLSHLSSALADVDQAREVVERSTESARELSERRDALDKAVMRANAAMEVLHSGDELSQEIAKKETELQDLRRALAAIDEKITRLSSGMQLSAAARRELREAEELRIGRARRAADAESVERSLLRTLGLDTRPSDVALAQLKAERESVLRQAKLELDELDLITPLASATASLESTLARLPDRIGGQLILSEPPLTVAELRRGVRSRRLELEGQPRPEALSILQARIDAIERQLKQMDLLARESLNTDRKRELLRQVDAKIAALLRTISAGGTDEYRAAQDERGRGRAREIELEVDLAAGRERQGELLAKLDLPTLPFDAGGRVDRAALAAFVREGIAHLGLADVDTPDDPKGRLANLVKLLNDAHLEAVRAAQEARESLELALERRRDTELTLVGVRQRVRAAFQQLLRWSDERVPQSVEMLAQRLGTSATGIAEASPLEFDITSDVATGERHAAAILGDLSRSAEALAENAATVVSAANAAYAYVMGQARRLRPNPDLGTSPADINLDLVPRQGQLRSWVEEHIAATFGEEELRRELFDNADRIAFDLTELAFSWAGRLGSRKRPLEAFSSGEQVFAYTKAKLEALRSVARSTRDVLVVLDEFGAFVSRDRMGSLIRFVEHEALGTLASQVVVMLPLTLSYGESNAEAPLGEDFDFSLTPREQVARWRYFARDASKQTVLPVTG